MEGYIHSFESLAAVDGEGVRYAIFMQGCNLRCVYCHNPDTWNKDGGKFTPEELIKKVIRYKLYFADNGGVTFSGGEPLLQAEFIKKTVPLLQSENIKYVIDTSGNLPLNDDIKYVLKNAQEILLDLKFWDSESYKKYTGGSFENVIKTLEFLNDNGIKTIIRTVVVPDINDSFEIMDKYIDIVKDVSCVKKYELLGFHTMGFFKYDNLKIENPLKNVSALDVDKKNELIEYVNKKMKG